MSQLNLVPEMDLIVSFLEVGRVFEFSRVEQFLVVNKTVIELV